MSSSSAAEIVSSIGAPEVRGMEVNFETYAGIEEFRNAHLPGFTGILKQRWSDFIVQEVVKMNDEKRVAKLTKRNGIDLENASFVPDVVQHEDFSVQGLMTDLSTVMGADDARPALEDSNFVEFLNKCREKAEDCEPEFLTMFSSNEKTIRTALHKAFKSHASAFIDTGTKGVDGKVRINLVAKHKSSKADRKEAARRSSGQWPKDLPEYLRFTMLKQNVSTNVALDFICRTLKVGENRFQYAGVKDKRGTTTQWVTMRYGKPSHLGKVAQERSTFARNIRFGDFEYVSEPHRLGALYGNRFGVILRELNRPDSEILDACKALEDHGFINFYGLQRFGKGEFGAKSCDVGREIFRGDFEKATRLLFTVSHNIDDNRCIETKNAFNAGDLDLAMQCIPNSMNAEKAALKKLREAPEAHEEAIGAISKGTRLMYVHAYQSLLWNRAASERVRMGFNVIEGDLVVNREAKGVDPSSNEIALSSTEVDNEESEKEEVNIQRREVFDSDIIHHVTADDLANNRYSMRDVLIPVVGSMVKFPTHSLGKFYTDMLETDSLSIECFSTGPSQYRMSGVYRKLLRYPEDFHYSIKRYVRNDEEIIQTDFQRNAEKESKPKVVMYSKAATQGPSAPSDEATKRALHLEFTLTSGSYATMMIREITRESTDTGRQADLTSAAASTLEPSPIALKKARYE